MRAHQAHTVIDELLSFCRLARFVSRLSSSIFFGEFSREFRAALS